MRECPNFRYKKLLILMGANAAGKTSLGQMFNRVFNFMLRRQTDKVINSVCDRSREAKILLDFVPSSVNPELYRLEVIVNPTASEQEPEILSRLTKTKIMKTDSYERACQRIDTQTEHYTDYLQVAKMLPPIGFFFSYPSDVLPGTVPMGGSEVYREVLEKVLRVLDAGILHVEVVPDAKNSYNIYMASGQNMLMQEGQLVNTSLLSSGTKAGIGIAYILSAMKEHICGFYYCIDCVNASEYLKRNTDSLRKAVENDMFSVFPDTEQIESIAHG